MRACSRAIAIVVIVASPVALAVPGAPGPEDDEAYAGWTPAEGRQDNHCLVPSPIGNIDLNQALGYTTQLVTRICNVIHAGQFYTPIPQAWVSNTAFGNDTWPLLYPPGYVPERPAPIDDFIGKITSVTYVIDAGTAQETTMVFPPAKIVRVHTQGTLRPFLPPDDAELPFAFFLPKLLPEAVGTHTVDRYVTMRALHYDGLSAEPAAVLPAGVTFFGRVTYTVTPPSAP